MKRNLLLSAMLAALSVQSLAAEPRITDLGWPYREVAGKAYNCDKAAGWLPIYGKAIQKVGAGSYLVRSGEATAIGETIILVKGLPLDLADEQSIPTVRLLRIGNTSYTTVLGSQSTVLTFDYGQRIPVPSAKTVIKR